MAQHQEALEILKEQKAVLDAGHFVYTSGKHGATYINKDAIYPDILAISKLCAILASHFADSGAQVVAGPTVGGVVLTQWVAYHLIGAGHDEVVAVFAEEAEDKTRIFKRGYDKLVAGKNVLVVEDVLTTGASVKKVVDAVVKLGGRPIGVAALCNRGNIEAAALGVRELFSLVNLPMQSWEAKDCPLCKKGVPVNVEVGKGSAWVKI